MNVQLRKYGQAISHLKLAVKLARQSTETQAALALAYAAAGKHKQSVEILAQLQDLRGQRYVLPYNLARAYAAGRNIEKAFKWLEVAYQEGNPDLIELNSEPIFDGLRDDSRFTGLMRRVGWKV